MLAAMLTEHQMVVCESRRRSWAPPGSSRGADVKTESRRKKPAARAVAAQKRAARPPAPKADAAVPEGWHRRVREQAHNLARAVEMLEQAIAMMSEPKSHSLARAECLRGAGLLTLVAAAELLVVAGWFEADQAVRGGVV